MQQREQTSEGAPIYITANTLVNANVVVETAIHIAQDAGADGFELRRELLPPTMPPDEVQSLRSQLAMFPSPPVYSTPCPLFTKGRFEREPLLRGLEEARSFGCRLVKFSPIGMEPGEREFGELLSFLQKEAPGLTVTVENDQSAASSDVAQWVRFFERAAALACPIWMTFDLGNWTCVGSDPIEAAQRLGLYVAYIHAKSVERKDGQWVSQPIHIASVHHPALVYLPNDAPRAIEFPLTAAHHEALSTTLRTYITRLRSGNFTTS